MNIKSDLPVPDSVHKPASEGHPILLRIARAARRAAESVSSGDPVEGHPNIVRSNGHAEILKAFADSLETEASLLDPVVEAARQVAEDENQTSVKVALKGQQEHNPFTVAAARSHVTVAHAFAHFAAVLAGKSGPKGT